MSLPHVEIVGNLVEDPILRMTSNGTPVATIRIGTSERKQDETGQWIEKDKCYINAICWREKATLVAENLNKGEKVAIMGKLRQNDYTDKEGNKRSSYEIDATTVSKVIGNFNFDKTAHTLSEPVFNETVW
jgi:single-strand DNA-binding protein